MAEDPSFLRRWSRRKHEAVRPAPGPADPALPAAAPVVATPVAAPVATPGATPAPAEPPPLPPVESLTLASDFRPFLSAKVDETVKRAALRKLFSDPHFNVMDGLDTYIDDYSIPDPMPEGFLDKLADVYKTLEEKVAEAKPSDAVVVAADTPSIPAEPATNDDQDANERQG